MRPQRRDPCIGSFCRCFCFCCCLPLTPPQLCHPERRLALLRAAVEGPAAAASPRKTSPQFPTSTVALAFLSVILGEHLLPQPPSNSVISTGARAFCGAQRRDPCIGSFCRCFCFCCCLPRTLPQLCHPERRLALLRAAVEGPAVPASPRTTLPPISHHHRRIGFSFCHPRRASAPPATIKLRHRGRSGETPVLAIVFAAAFAFCSSFPKGICVRFTPPQLP